jgi:kynureninase
LKRYDVSEECARQLDSDDPLAEIRAHFYMPKGTIYMDGNSLGLLSRESEHALYQVLDEWKKLGVQGWLTAKQPWFYFAEKLGALVCPLVGAREKEVVATGTTTVNIHALIGTFYNPLGRRRKIVADELNFPSDIYALRSQLEFKGYNPSKNLELVASPDGRFLDEDAIVQSMTEEVALVFLPSVLYRSGQLLDIKYLTKEAHKRRILIGFDCSHSVGTVPHEFNNWQVDFAVWCSYKYLNGGPGSSAFLYIHRKHFKRNPRFQGWFGYIKEKQFDMTLDFQHQESAGGWQISSPCILGCAPLMGSLGVIREAGIHSIREKSKKITDYLIYLVDHLITEEPYSFSIGSPRDPQRRGGHVAVERNKEAWRICEALKARGVITDFRFPNIIRFAPVALYNTYHEVWVVIQYLKKIIDEAEYKRFTKSKRAVL